MKAKTGPVREKDAAIRADVERILRGVALNSSSFCMDEEDERNALADAATCELIAAFHIRRRARPRKSAFGLGFDLKKETP
jgi:hypothetical protein